MNLSETYKRRIQELAGVVNESYTNALSDSYFMKRVPFFKSFENNSGGREVRFNHYKNWQGSDAAILHFGKDNGFVEFPFLSVETKFSYWTVRRRDFDSEGKLPVFRPLFSTDHFFAYSTDIHMTLPEPNELDNVPNQIASLMFKEIIKNELKFDESFEVKDGESMPKEKLDAIINTANKNLFKIEETLQKMDVSYF